MKAVQEHLGHTTPCMTHKYSHLNPDFQRSEVARLNGLCDEGIESGKKSVRSGDSIRITGQPEAIATAQNSSKIIVGATGFEPVTSCV